MRTAGNWTFRPFVSSPHWTYSTFPQRFLLIQLKPKYVFRHGGLIFSVLAGLTKYHVGHANRIGYIGLRCPVDHTEGIVLFMLEKARFTRFD